jgi:hypothetical protein
MKEKISERVKAHHRYKLLNGDIVPGVTTITGMLDKSALKIWANNIGLRGISISKYVDEKASIGTLIHSMVSSHIKKEKLNISEYSPDIISKAENGFLKYLEWEKQYKPEVIHSEKELVSENYKFGGQFDLLASIEDKITLVDFKSGSGLYKEHLYQVAGYALLIEDCLDFTIDNHIILRIGRDEEEGFEQKTKANLDIEKQIFKKLLEVYYLQKEV